MVLQTVYSFVTFVQNSWVIGAVEAYVSIRTSNNWASAWSAIPLETY